MHPERSVRAIRTLRQLGGGGPRPSVARSTPIECDNDRSIAATGVPAGASTCLPHCAVQLRELAVWTATRSNLGRKQREGLHRPILTVQSCRSPNISQVGKVQPRVDCLNTVLPELLYAETHKCMHVRIIGGTSRCRYPSAICVDVGDISCEIGVSLQACSEAFRCRSLDDAWEGHCG